jgi:type II secretory pathway predicted ATPase ExeA/Mrp family chromosome partitioning ATPase
MYLDFYSLKAIPFTPSYSLGEVSASKNRQEIVERLLKEINRNSELKVLISEKGSGKTTLIHSLIESISDDFYVIPILKPAKTTFDLLTQMCTNLEIPFSSLAIDEIIPRILDHLKQTVKSGRKPLLILDDAHVSSKNIFEVVQNLFRLNKSISNFLRVFLVGEQILEQKLYEINEKFHLEKNWKKIKLEKLSLDESKYYINNRLLEVKNGQKVENIFTENAVKKIVHYSKGNPRRINILCNNALVLGYLKSAKRIDGEIIEKVKSDDICLYEIKNLLGRNKKRTQLKATSNSNIKSVPNTIDSPKKEKRVEKTKPNISSGISWEGNRNVLSKRIKPAPALNRTAKKNKSEPQLVHLNDHTEPEPLVLHHVIENILINSKDQKLKVIGITSPISGQGSSTIALEISKQLSKRTGLNTPENSSGLLFIDANYQNPVHKSNKGIEEIISIENENIENVIAKTNLSFSYLSTGKTDNLSQKFIKKIETYFTRFTSHFDFIIVDLPPVLQDQKSNTYAQFCDGVIMVVQAGKSKWEVVEEAKRQLEKLGVPILGGVLNKRKYFIPNWLYKMV